mmetsp:Transcript_8443/g.35322  ORF Transcript_8443/g.35322 Transcript_8443/m.35322 type:complete len:238 (+) Transcript_8443:160-873(+)
MTCDPMAASCAPVPVKSHTMSSLPFLPLTRPETICPSSACTSSAVITPAAMALRTSPTRAHCAVMSVTTFAFLSTLGGISFFVGWSLPLQTMRACGLSHDSSSTHSPPGVCVNTTSAARTASSAEPHAANGYPSSSDILSQKVCALETSRLYANASSNPNTVAVERAMDSAMTPVPMNATLLAPLTARCFTATAPAAPVRRSVRYRFSCRTAFGPPFAASHTTNTPDPAGRPFSTFL